MIYKGNSQQIQRLMRMGAGCALGRKNCNLLILLLLFYGWSYDRASCINGKSGAELPSTPEGSCPPLNLMGCGIVRKPRRLRHDLLEDEGYSDARGVPL